MKSNFLNLYTFILLFSYLNLFVAILLRNRGYTNITWTNKNRLTEWRWKQLLIAINQLSGNKQTKFENMMFFINQWIVFTIQPFLVKIVQSAVNNRLCTLLCN